MSSKTEETKKKKKFVIIEQKPESIFTGYQQKPFPTKPNYKPKLHVYVITDSNKNILCVLLGFNRTYEHAKVILKYSRADMYRVKMFNIDSETQWINLSKKRIQNEFKKYGFAHLKGYDNEIFIHKIRVNEI